MEKIFETPKNIHVEDIRPVVPEPDESVLVIQRNARDNRDVASPDFGAITPKAIEQTRAETRKFFETIYKKLPPQDREKTDILIIGSDVTLTIPEGNTSEHKRGIETAAIVIKELKNVMDEFSIPKDNLINSFVTENGGPLEASELKDLQILEDSPGFVTYLKERYGTGKEFWIQYEEDTEEKTRENLEAEGPREIAIRIKNYLSLLSKLSTSFHKANPDRRLIIWAVSHYDSLSPFLKEHVTKTGIESYLGIDSGAGVSIKIDKEGKATTGIGDNEYEVSL